MFPVEVSTTYVLDRDVFLSFVRDLTEKTRADAALRESEQRFNTAFAFMPMALSIASLADGCLLAVNRAYATLLGYAEVELVGSTSGQLGIWASPEDRAKEIALVEAGGSVLNHEVQLRRKDGSLIWVSFSASKVSLDGRECLLSGLLDISDRRRAMEERLCLQAELSQSQKMDSLAQFSDPPKLSALKLADSFFPITTISR